LFEQLWELKLYLEQCFCAGSSIGACAAARSDYDTLLIKEEGPMDDVLCVTPLACWSPCDSDSGDDFLIRSHQLTTKT
jgi:hypothetical protein